MDHNRERLDEGSSWKGPSVVDPFEAEFKAIYYRIHFRLRLISNLLSHTKRVISRLSGARDRNVGSPMTRVQGGDGRRSADLWTPADFEARKDTTSGGSQRVLCRRPGSSEVKR